MLLLYLFIYYKTTFVSLLYRKKSVEKINNIAVPHLHVLKFYFKYILINHLFLISGSFNRETGRHPRQEAEGRRREP